MKISGATVHSYDLRYRFGDYGLSRGRISRADPALVVRLFADTGETGWGESSTLGRAHVVSFHESDFEALKILLEGVIGLDPRENLALQVRMGSLIKAAMGAKSAIDIACWDMAGKAAGLPVSVLLGGQLQDRCRAWDSVPLLAPDAIVGHVQEKVLKGVSVVQIKVGTNPIEDVRRVRALEEAMNDKCLIVADANAGWNVQNALIAMRAMQGARVIIEQPCASLSNCALVREATSLPMIIDEGLQSMDDLIDIKQRVGAGGISIKPGKLGGLTRAKLIRDAAVELGMMVTIDDLWGGSITSAALIHLAASTPRDALLAVTPFADLTLPPLGAVPLCDSDGTIAVPHTPGLGIDIDSNLLSPPLHSVGSVR